MIRNVRFVIFVIALWSIAPAIWASAPADGTITATQSCEAYVSKNKRTNPGRVQLVIDESYPVFEVNKPSNPTWFRVRIPSATPQERWVAEHCGTIDVQIGGRPRPDDRRDNVCRTPGLEDSYVLALSWQPAFCETHRNKPECRIDDDEAYQARNFTLHGLWPNKKECGTNYGFCGEVRSRRGDFCDYPRLELFTEVRADLEQVMPSAAEGSCLQRHEWFKHGKRIQLKCKGGNLVDVYISLPSTINKGDGLGALMAQAQSKFKSNCGGQFKVDPIGFAQ